MMCAIAISRQNRHEVRKAEHTADRARRSNHPLGLHGNVSPVATVVCPQCEHPCEASHRFCPVCGFPVAEVSRRTDDPLIGTTLPGGYVILELISVGGMGRVYRAEQKALGRTVAVKIIHPHLSGDESTSVRFITEARATSRLNHPNSVSVIDFGKNGSQLYLVMEFLRGRDLARITSEEGFLPFRRIAEVMCQVLAALAEAHHLGIIHRDLKPENIVLERLRSGNDFVKVVDFGLAKMKQVEVPATNITSPGIVCGTPDFMAPEQARGDTIDGRSDLYACGVILFQLLTGRLPFEAESPTQVVLMHLSMPPPDPREIAPGRLIPDELVEITRTALEKDPTKRYQTAEEFADALREAMASLEPPSIRARHESSVSCPNCPALVPAGQRFCGDCGTRVTLGSDRVPRSPVIGRDTTAAAPRLPLPLTAREEDLAWLAARRAEVDGSTLGARLLGDHGVGKTRLLAELRDDAAAAGDFVVATGPDPWWADLPYFALRRAIVRLAGLPTDGGRAADWVGATPEARAGLAEIFGRKGRAAEPDHLWADTPGGRMSPEDQRFIAAEALRWAITRAQRASRDRHIVVTIDDLQAVDGASRNAFADVLAEPPLVPMLLIAAHVPDFDPDWGGPARVLTGLPPAVAIALVRGLPQGRSVGLENRIVPPLYLDQLVRLSLEGGGDPPARVADLIALRIERVSPDARRVLQAVSVIGDAADRATLRQMAAGVEDLERALLSLVIAGMVERRRFTESSSVFERAGADEVFATTHPLLREVAAAGMPAEARRVLHARAIADEDGEPFDLPLEVRALHAYQSLQSEEGLMLLDIVADRAAARGDQHGSQLALRRGLELARRELFRGELEAPERAVLIFSRKLGESLASAGALTDADGVLREALDLAGPSGRDRAQVLGALALVAHQRERHPDAAGFLREATELARQVGDGELLHTLESMRRDWAPR
jgi:serine/threonine-protein kinase